MSMYQVKGNADVWLKHKADQTGKTPEALLNTLLMSYMKSEHELKNEMRKEENHE